MKIYRKKFIIYLKTIKGKMMRKKKKQGHLSWYKKWMIMKANPTIMYRPWKPVAVTSVDF